MRRLLTILAALAAAHGGHALAQDGAVARAPSPTTISAPMGQLSDLARPTAYRIDMTIDPAQPRFAGQVEIDVDLKRPAASIHIHGKELTVKSVSARVGGQVTAGEWSQIDALGLVELRFRQQLPAGPVTLTFAFDAAFHDGPSGLFRVKVGDQWFSWSQFQSTDARAAFPSFDQPSFKVPFTLTIRTPPGLMAVSNAPESGVRREAGLDVHQFAPTLPLPTYMVAMMVGPFVAIEGQVPPTPQRPAPLPLRIVSTPQNAGKLDFAMQGSQEIVALLEDYFGDAFPYPKLDQITSPIMPGAMENAGADLYLDSMIVLDGDAPITQRRYFGMVVAHELGHQWFGDLVTPQWWDDIWLNESFANWIGYRIGHAWKPELNIGAGALAEGFAAMQTDALVAGRPIQQPIRTTDQIDGAFDTITYGKGGHVVAMIAAFMGDDTFRSGVRRYMAAHRYGSATSTDFFAALAAAAGDARIVPAMQGFIRQQGVPLLTFTPTASGYRVSQSRYAPHGVTPPETHWDVPVCTRRGAVRACQLLADKHAELTIGGAGPLVPNADGTGYYRFELTGADWSALIANAGSLSGGEALAAADSLYASVLAGRASVIQLAQLGRALADHPDSYASDAAISAIAGLVSSGVVNTPARRGWSRFKFGLFAPSLARMGFDPRAGAYAAEEPEKSQRRVQLVDRLMGTNQAKALRRTLLEATRRYLGGDTSALDPAWLEHGLDTYLARGGEAAARDLLERALASQDPGFRPAALRTLSYSGNNRIARWLLESVSDPRLRESERNGFLSGVMLTGATREYGYGWLRANLDRQLAGRTGLFFATRLPTLLSRFCSVTKADEFTRELRPRFVGKTGALELERVIEKVRNCGTLREAKGQEITDGLASLR